jgi:prepilin-type N-terminal cleavage/methylation domain-containing protein
MIRETKKTTRAHAQSGVTMVELLIAVLLAGIVTSAAFSVYITQHKQWIVQDEIADMQANIRAASDELTTQIRMAGQGLPDEFPGGAIWAFNTNPDTIVIIYDTGALTGVETEQPMAQPSAELLCDGHDLSGLHDGEWAYIFDPNNNTGEYFLASQVDDASDRIIHASMPLSRVYPVGSRIMKLARKRYYISTADPNHPTFMLQNIGQNAEPYAENITALNIRYVLSSGAVVDVPPRPNMVREVLLTIDSRTNQSDTEFQRAYRQRSITTRAKVRNLGMN